MGIIITRIFVALLAGFVSSTAFSQGNSHGPESPLVVGTVSEVRDNGDVIVKQKAGGHVRHLKFPATYKSWYSFFEGAGMGKVDKPDKGYVVKARVKHKDGIDHVSNISYYPPLPPSVEIPNRTELSPEVLFTKADANHNGEIDYVEYSVSIARSEKHGGAFAGKDKDKSDGLNLAEFREALKGVSWYRYSRKTAADYLAEADKNNDKLLSPEEFKHFSGKERHFKRTDDDSSGGISVEELAAYLKVTQ